MNLFIDTNVLLSFYHLTNDDLEELRKLSVLIDQGKINLILPRQVIHEFKRNRESKISDSLKKLNEQKTKSQFPQICKDYPEYKDLRAQQSKYQKSHSQLIQKLSEDIRNKNLKADVIIQELFSKGTIIETSNEVVDKAKIRMAIGNPPGKKGSFGDAINWESILQSIEEEKDIHFVADDKDYFSILDDQEFDDFLLDEWKNNKKSDLFYYRRLSTFFKEHFPHIKLASELEKEILIGDLANSGNFKSTHSAIEKLSKHTDFTVAQVDEILSAAIDNRQVRWIITDEDVKDFISTIISGKEDHLNADNLSKINDLLKEDEKEEVPFPEISEDVPF